MKKMVSVIVCCSILLAGIGQNVNQQLQQAFRQFENDGQLKYAISSLYVIDAGTGKVVFDKNSLVGLAPASTQKIITSITAFALLGSDYRFATDLGYTGKIEDGLLEGSLWIRGNGDPTLGSWRWPSTREETLVNDWTKNIKAAGIKRVEGSILTDRSKFDQKTIPDGWIWQDIGNYYGAGAEAINWKENQLDVTLQSGAVLGSSVKIVSPSMKMENELTAARKGSGDNAYVYLPVFSRPALISGTIPVSESSFRIAITDVQPSTSLAKSLRNAMLSQQITSPENVDQYGAAIPVISQPFTLLSRTWSPSLDSIIYWFNKKSINLYGEALVKAFALEKTGRGITDTGVAIIRKFWKDKGIAEDELNMRDGSGLSPLNRVTTHAQVTILRYARAQNWFNYFYDALPEYHGMKMKSGTISDVKGFCGYHRAKDGKEYVFSFLVNNYSGRSSELVGKMYKVLDALK